MGDDRRYTKTGQPKMGTKFDVVHEGGHRDTLTIVAKGWGKGYADLIKVCTEWEDGYREWWPWSQLADAITYAELHPEAG